MAHQEVHGYEDALEALLAEIMVAVSSLEYGALTVAVKGGQVVRLERHEKRRLAKPPTRSLGRKARTPRFKEQS